jgi:hypothetical protein
VTLAASALFPSSSPSLEADAIALDQFIGLLFRYADERTFVSWRAFPDDADKGRPVFIESSIVTDDRAQLAEAATYWATKAAQFPAAGRLLPADRDVREREARPRDGSREWARALG